MKKINKKFKSFSGIFYYFLIIIFPITIILSNFQMLQVNKNFYTKLYEKSGVWDNFESKQEVLTLTDNILSYYQGKDELDRNLFTDQAILHLKDVKYLLDSTRSLFTLTIFASFICFAVLIIFDIKKIFSSILMSSIIVIGFITLLGIGLLNSFESIFLLFHKLTFNNNLWQFSESDTLIKLFPQEFFYNFANSLAVNIIASSITLIAFSVIALNYKKWLHLK